MTPRRSADGEGQPSGRSGLARLVSAVDRLIVERPLVVVAAFALVSLVLVPAAPSAFADQEAGAGQFQEAVPEYDTLEAMQEDFDQGGRETGGTSAQVFITDERNVLSTANLERMLAAQSLLESRDSLRISSTTTPASEIAMAIDPKADTTEAQKRVLEGATRAQIESAIADRGDRLMVDVDFSPSAGTASVAQMGITYETPPDATTETHADLQFETLSALDRMPGYEAGANLVIFGEGVTDREVGQLLGDTSMVVFPAALVLILLFLIVAYRDPVDLLIGLLALVLSLLWTFGFMSYVGIPYSDSIFTVFPLLLAVGIDFGIHIINRYREERAASAGIGPAMSAAGDQLGTAFLIVTLTTLFSFAANLTSPLEGIRYFGIVAGVGIVFTFLLFAVFLPAAKVLLDRIRAGMRFPQFGSAPLGRKGSIIGRILSIGTALARVSPAVVLVLALVLGAGGAAYGAGVDVEFSEEVFFPEEERIEQYNTLPEPFAVGSYNFVQAQRHFEEDFETPLVQTVSIYVTDRDVRADYALRDVHRAVSDSPTVFESDEGRDEASNVLDVIDAQAERDPAFADLLRRYDETGNGVPDREVDRIYDELFASASAADAEQFLTSDRGATRIELQPTVDASDRAVVAAAESVATDMRLEATPTGDYIVSQAVIDRITESAVRSLVIAFFLVLAVLLIAYWRLEGRAIYGVLNLFPVLLTVALLVASMRWVGIALSPINAPLLAVTIGLGVDYTVHYMHRFVDEFETTGDVLVAIDRTAHGTGGAMTGSMLTTVAGLGVLYLALIPILAEFGLLLALGVLYAYLSAIVVLPSAIVVWDRFAVGDPTHGD